MADWSGENFTDKNTLNNGREFSNEVQGQLNAQSLNAIVENIFYLKKILDENGGQPLPTPKPNIESFSINGYVDGQEIESGSYSITSIFHRESNIEYIEGTLTLVVGAGTNGTAIKSGILPNEIETKITLTPTEQELSKQSIQNDEKISWTLFFTSKSGDRYSSTVTLYGKPYSLLYGASSNENETSFSNFQSIEIENDSLSINVQAQDNEYIYILIPTEKTVTSIIYEGLEYREEFKTDRFSTINNINYKIYRTPYRLNADNYIIKIGIGE